MVEMSSYEEVRRQRLEENKKKFQELGISQISASLARSSNANSPNKTQQRRLSKSTPKTTSTVELRRSTRARNPAPSYRDDVDIDLLPHLRKRSSSHSSSWASYLARPLDEVKTASYEERLKAFQAAEDLQNSLQSGNPSFVKSMVRSHVYSCFWLGLPSKFCEDHLPKSTEDMVLEDENGAEFGAVYIGKRAGLSGGWRAFALEHKLDDGDALVFELIQPARFKVYIIRASSVFSQGCEADNADKGNTDCSKRKTRGSMKAEGLPSSQELQHKDGVNVSQKLEKRGKSGKEELAKDGGKFASSKSRKRPATRSSFV